MATKVLLLTIVDSGVNFCLINLFYKITGYRFKDDLEKVPRLLEKVSEAVMP